MMNMHSFLSTVDTLINIGISKNTKERSLLEVTDFLQNQQYCEDVVWEEIGCDVSSMSVLDIHNLDVRKAVYSRC